MTDAFVIQGGRDVAGHIYVSGSKNAGLALMAATVLTRGTSTIQGLPDVSDIDAMAQILEHLGAGITKRDDIIQINTTSITTFHVPDRLATRLRASILLLGPLLARYGHAKLSFPGGCTIGSRPIDEHVRGLEALGACVKVTDDFIEAHATQIHAASLNLQVPSVTGTMNLIMAACLAQGITHIHNAACEPEVVDLISCLVAMGAQIEGAGTDHIIITGYSRPLSPCQYKVMEDRIETGTYLILGAICGDPLTVHRCHAKYNTVLIKRLRAVGASIDVLGTSITVHKAKKLLPFDIQTGPYPGFPTDLQPQFMVLLSLGQGKGKITETVYEQRFKQAEGLQAMGANIRVRGQIATISGISNLFGADVVGTDLRATASLIIAAIAARGFSIIRNVNYIDRGYHDLERKLQKIGVDLARVYGGYGIDKTQIEIDFPPPGSVPHE
ncbi:unnamed protein product [Penicillium olsonii]|uniref:UDP-N-acetylglucosamine 1-carboxyvinyltransferase n=1 Tax=Penicillium olsonii TaxID=99116 RepID=A0A9W4HL59_PENOL|nr:unnamed protein product [Penicillium olsonii]